MKIKILFLIYLFIKKILLCYNYIKIFENYIDFDYISKYFIINNYKNNDNMLNNFEKILMFKYPICIFDLKFDNYLNKEFEKYDNEIIDLTQIFPYEVLKNNTIKIIHKGNTNIKNKELCIFGILENKEGLKIEKEMLEWLLDEYDVYCVYQKAPGVLYEYPAIRFAQWIINKKEQNLCLYIHTKGAFHSSAINNKIRFVWKNEYSGSRKKKYIYPLKNNLSDATCILSSKKGNTWFNGFFISKRGFDILGTIKTSEDRYLYESLFQTHQKARVWGILRNKVKASRACKIINKYKPELYSDKLKFYINRN